MKFCKKNELSKKILNENQSYSRELIHQFSCFIEQEYFSLILEAKNGIRQEK